MPMRATVYTCVNGAPVRRDIVELPVDSVIVFKSEVIRALTKNPTLVTHHVEFGPVGEPWRFMHRKVEQQRLGEP